MGDVVQKWDDVAGVLGLDGGEAPDKHSFEVLAKPLRHYFAFFCFILDQQR